MLNFLPPLLAAAALVVAPTARSAEYRNEIGVAAATGLSSSDPEGFGSIFYQRAFANGVFTGGSFGGGSVLAGRTSVRFSALAGYRFMQADWGNALWPQASVEAAIPLFMGYDNGNGIYLNLGIAGALQERLLYGIELQFGRVKHSGAAVSAASGSANNLRASLGYRF
jgi:hypothetical protein